MDDFNADRARSLTPSELHRRQQERKERMTPTKEANTAPFSLASRVPSAPRSGSPPLLPREVLERGSTPPYMPEARERSSPPLLPSEVLRRASPVPQAPIARERSSPPLVRNDQLWRDSVPPTGRSVNFLEFYGDSQPSTSQSSASLPRAPSLIQDQRESFERERTSAPDNRTAYYGLAIDYSTSSPPLTPASKQGEDDIASRQKLAELREELLKLRSTPVPLNSRQEELQRLRKDISRLDNDKAQVVSQANKDKAYFDMEIKQLKIEVQKASDKSSKTPKVAEGDFMDRLRLRKEFEENFTRTLRDLRKELEQTSLKEIALKNRLPVAIRNMIQLSNERLDKVMEDAALIPVEERIHIETLRLLIENAKLRKVLNDYSEGLLRNTIIKSEPSSSSPADKGGLMGLLG